MEPLLCGAGEVYLNFGCFYDVEGMSARRDALLSLRKANRAAYPAAYAELAAARDLIRCARSAARSVDPEGLFRLTRRLIELPEPNGSVGRCRDVFLRAWTPEGLMDFTPDAVSGYRSCAALADPCALSAPLLERLAQHCQSAGYDCIRVLSPIDPSRPEGLLVPALGKALLTNPASGIKCAVKVDVESFFPQTEQTRELLARADACCAAAAARLAEARAIHDELEALCRPYISYEGVDLLTREYQKQLREELLKK